MISKFLFSAFHRRACGEPVESVSGTKSFSGLTHKLVWSKAAGMVSGVIRRIIAVISRLQFVLNFGLGHLNLSFDFSQDGEPVEPFRISEFVFRIWLRPEAALSPLCQKTVLAQLRQKAYLPQIAARLDTGSSYVPVPAFPLGLFSAFHRRTSGTKPFSGMTHKLVWSKAAGMVSGVIRRIIVESPLCSCPPYSLCSLCQKISVLNFSSLSCPSW